MGWATDYIAKLQKGETVEFRPRGNSMTPKIESGQLCRVEPIGKTVLKVGDVVLCKVGGSQYLHIINCIQGNRCQIRNNHGRINGWTNFRNIYGKLISVS